MLIIHYLIILSNEIIYNERLKNKVSLTLDKKKMVIPPSYISLALVKIYNEGLSKEVIAIMDIKRAQEIMNNATMINVSYRGIPVYLQKVHAENETATIFPLDEMNNEQIVDLDNLFETGP